MGEPELLPYTKAGMSNLFGEINTRLTVIELTTGKLDRALNGNGKPGLIDDHRKLQQLVEDHLKQAQEYQDARALLAEETKKAKELLAMETKESKDLLAKDVKANREKISARIWAVVLLAIGIFLTQAAGLIVLFIRTGGIK